MEDLHEDHAANELDQVRGADLLVINRGSIEDQKQNRVCEEAAATVYELLNLSLTSWDTRGSCTKNALSAALQLR